MKRAYEWIAAGTFLLAVGCGCTSSTAPLTAPMHGDVAKIETLLNDQAQAWNKGDLDGFMAGYWDSPDLEFVSSSTTKGFGPTKERYFKRYKAEGKEMGTLTFSDIAVTLNGDREATATGKWKVVMSQESPSGGFTLTLRKFDIGWKIVKDVTTSDEPPKK